MSRNGHISLVECKVEVVAQLGKIEKKKLKL
jgi:hypothetical protein